MEEELEEPDLLADEHVQGVEKEQRTEPGTDPKKSRAAEEEGVRRPETGDEGGDREPGRPETDMEQEVGLKGRRRKKVKRAGEDDVFRRCVLICEKT
eukprot:544921-Hanusia_phi.AAC.4